MESVKELKREEIKHGREWKENMKKKRRNDEGIG